MDEQGASSSLRDYNTWVQLLFNPTGGFNYQRSGTVGYGDICRKQYYPASSTRGFNQYTRDWSGATFVGYKNVSLHIGPGGPSYGPVQECEQWEVAPLAIGFPDGGLSGGFQMWAGVEYMFLLPPEAASAPSSAPQTNWSRIRAVTLGGPCAQKPCTDPNAPEPWDGTTYCSTDQVAGIESCYQYPIPKICEDCCAGCPTPAFTPVNRCQNVTLSDPTFNTTMYNGYCVDKNNSCPAGNCPHLPSCVGN
jgi:hypothetical protein